MPAKGAGLAAACLLVFFGGTAGSGAMIDVLLSDPAVDAASAAGAGSVAGAPASSDALAVTEVLIAAVASAADAAGFAAGAGFEGAGADPPDGGVAAAFIAAPGAGSLCGMARADVDAELPELLGGGAAAIEAGGSFRGIPAGDAAGLGGGAEFEAATGFDPAGIGEAAAGVDVAAVATGAAGDTDGTAAARTLVTIARAATGTFSGSLGRSISERTTPAPAVAPIAVATSTTRAVRAKLGAGAK